jgi:hypothetical protein
MKFTVIKDLRKDRIMRPILSSALLFGMLFIVADLFVKHNGFGITPTAIKMSVLGDEEQFLDPLGKNVFLEFWHVEIFSIMMVCFIVSTIYIRLSNGSKKALFIVNVMLISAILSLVFLPLLYFLSSSFIYPYLFTFYTWHLCAFFASAVSLKAFYSE